MLPFTPKVLFDTKALAKYLYSASETHLETLAKKYGIEHTNPHDAENDALVTAKVFNAMFGGESKEIKEAKQKLEKYRREQLDGLMRRLGYENGFSEEFVSRVLSDIKMRQSKYLSNWSEEFFERFYRYIESERLRGHEWKISGDVNEWLRALKNDRLPVWGVDTLWKEMKTKNIPLDKETKLAFARSRQVPTYVLYELVKSEYYDVDVVRKIAERNDIPDKLLLEIIKISKVKLGDTTDTVLQSRLKDLIGFASYKYSTWHNMSGKAVLEKYQPRTSSAGSSLSDSSNQKNELAQTYIEDEEILNSDLKNDIINPEDKIYGHKVNDITQQG